FRKSTFLSVEGKFGTFCLSCKAYESGSAVGTYGFGLAYCDDNIKEMSNKIDYDEIEKFKVFLKDKGLSDLLDRVVKIEQTLKSNNTEKYFTAVKDYSNEIESLDKSKKELLQSYLRQ
ncbi:MAG: hypothetical protein RSH24_19815, partial [Flavobacterium sp.]